ncbi:hypothetical protein LTR56_026802 [Elasticomyces elasticus]|nr:hypothetical protein LTR56_026802 [Elasticomyces elasticus]KAK5722990.1 hypothetical protein LTS12_027555 [Elasticomyces elasticus]
MVDSGWTLQEMLAPNVVEFYDKTGTKLGDKTTLERHICDITGIPAKALRGNPLSSFSIDERFSWQRSRNTKKPEDLAYSLAGVCEVTMIPVYGEGGEKAMARLRREIDEVSKGTKRHNYAVPFSLAGVAEAQLFVGRENELHEIHVSLGGDGSRRMVVLHGLGGIGKTQTAVAYATRHRNSYSAIFWFNIRDDTSVTKSFVEAAKRILQHHPSAYRLSTINMNGDLDDVVETVKAWLSEADNTRWLAVYDNYDNPKVHSNNDPTAVDIRKFLPDAYQGSIIITTRSSQVRIGRSIPVRKFTGKHEAIEILSSMSRRDLAIDEYLHLYESSWRQLHVNGPRLETYEDRTLYSTWLVSLDRIRQNNKLSASLLGLWCYFGNEDLYLTASLHDFTEVMRPLCNYGLVEGKMVLEEHGEERVESNGYSIHGCVHSWTVEVLNERWDDSLAQFAINAIGRHVPAQDTVKPWVTQRRLLQHANRFSKYLSKEGLADVDMEDSSHNLGNLFRTQDKLAQAKAMYMRALERKERALGLEHKSTLLTVLNIGNLYRDQGKLGPAEKMYKRALEGYEKVLGAEHTSTLVTVNNLGILYMDQGKLGQAEEMYERALKRYEKVLGAEHTSTLMTVNNLGILYADQGKLAQAEGIYERALRGYEKALGVEHTSTLRTADDLRILHADQERAQQAEETEALEPATVHTHYEEPLPLAHNGKFAKPQHRAFRRLTHLFRKRE